MLPVAVFLLALLAFLHAEGPVTQVVAVILSAAAAVLALLSLIGVQLPAWRRPHE